MVLHARIRSRVAVALAVVAAGVIAGCGPDAASRTSPPTSIAAPARTVGPPFDPTRVTVSLEPVVDGFAAPLAVANAGDGSGRLFVVQQGGLVRIVRDGQIVEPAFLDIADRITSGGERGLLGLAFHPDFPKDPRLFVDYTDEQGDTRVSSFAVDPARPDRVDPTTERRLLFVDQPFANHNGGALAFDASGFLLVSLGDG